MDLTGKLLHGRYRVLRPIGDGAMGDVYLVQHRQHPELRFAMKVLKPHWAADSNFGARFRAEGKVLQRLDHPGIVPVHDSFEAEGALCMVLSFVEGESLAQRLRRRGPMDPDEALPIFKAVLAALDYAHQAGVVHRDVKPSNILIDLDDRPRLCDFGIAKKLGERGATQIGTTLGTPAYMSPEQIRTPTEVDHRTDLYSAAVVLYQMLVGAVPFAPDASKSDYAVLEEHVSKEPPDPRSFMPDLDPRLVTVLSKALRKQPERRMQGGQEFIAALEQAERGAPLHPHVSRGRRLGEPTKQHHVRPHQDERPHEEQPHEAQTSTSRYAVYVHPTLGREAVKRGLSWPALIAGPLWLVAERFYGRALLWFSAEALLVAMMLFLNAQPHADAAQPIVIGMAAVALLIWVMPGLRGNQWREEALERQGWVAID